MDIRYGPHNPEACRKTGVPSGCKLPIDMKLNLYSLSGHHIPVDVPFSLQG